MVSLEVNQIPDVKVVSLPSTKDFNADADVKLPPSCDVKEFF